MKDINTLKKITNVSTTTFVILTIVTMGFFPIMWGWKHTDSFNEELSS